MKQKKQAAKRRPVTVARPLDKLGKKESVAHYNAILIEEIKSGMQQVIEGMESTRVVLEEKIDDFRKEVNGRFEVIEVAVTAHSKILNEHGTKVDNLQKTVEGHTVRLDSIEKGMGEVKGQLSTHSVKLESIETKIDGQNGRLDDHETRINALETPHL